MRCDRCTVPIGRLFPGPLTQTEADVLAEMLRQEVAEAADPRYVTPDGARHGRVIYLGRLKEGICRPGR